jgi:hypothetical protein
MLIFAIVETSMETKSRGARQSIRHGLSPTHRFPNSWQWKMLYYKTRRYQRGFLNVSIPKPKLGARKHGLTTLRRAINEIGNWVIDRRTVTGEALAQWRA